MKYCVNIFNDDFFYFGIVDMKSKRCLLRWIKKFYFYEYWSLSDVIVGLLFLIGFGYGDGLDRGGDLMR